MVQTLIENSLKFGFAKGTTDAKISVRFEFSDKELVITVHDNGAGLKSAEPNSSSFGLRSIKERLQSYKGSSFSIANNPNGVGVINTIVIPYTI
jgi:signal transduction histidine kinase